MRKLLFIFLASCLSINSLAQASLSKDLETISYSSPKQYILGGVTISGTKHLDHSTLIQISGLEVGKLITVPGDDFTQAIEKMWEQGLFSDVQIEATNIQGNSIFLNLYLEERPRLSKFKFSGIKKADIDNLRDQIKLVRGKIITENLLNNTTNIIRSYFVEKGFLNVEISTSEEEDPNTPNHVLLAFKVNKKERVKRKGLYGC